MGRIDASGCGRLPCRPAYSDSPSAGQGEVVPSSTGGRATGPGPGAPRETRGRQGESPTGSTSVFAWRIRPSQEAEPDCQSASPVRFDPRGKGVLDFRVSAP